jgi:transcriptional regulator with XRE-family HTH domain
MIIMVSDLRTTRIEKGLRLEDLASGMLRPATISEIENGLRVPRSKTRHKIESIIGPVDWRKTLFAGGRYHIMLALVEFINETGSGNPRERIRFAKQALTMIEETLKME